MGITIALEAKDPTRLHHKENWEEINKIISFLNGYFKRS